MFSVNYIFLMNITYVFAIITCLGFPVKSIRDFPYFELASHTVLCVQLKCTLQYFEYHDSFIIKINMFITFE